MKCLVMAFALTFVLAGTGFAGDIPSVPGPPPTPATAPAEKRRKFCCLIWREQVN